MGDSDGNEATEQDQIVYGANQLDSGDSNQNDSYYNSEDDHLNEQSDASNLDMDQQQSNSSARGRGRGPGQSRYRPPGYQAPGQARSSDFPLRILVLSDMVGAIIGKSGQTIRQITQETRARVDVHRKDNSGSPEKVITIYGNPENCSKACKKIMEVMTEEATATTRQEVPLKILAHNSFIGRIIGKSGNTIKRIMEDTNTKIAVSSNLHDMNSYNLERVITIKGAVDDICQAEQQISQKLRQSFESDLVGMQSQSMAFPGMHPMTMMPIQGPAPPAYPSRGHASAATSPYGMYAQNPYVAPVVPYGAGPAMGPGGVPAAIGVHFGELTKETVQVYIPNMSVGAIIGTGGSTIREMISSSGASIKVAQSKEEPPVAEDESPQPAGAPRSNERKVTIVGTPEAQWKAQFMLFRKVGFESQNGPQEAHLTVEIFVPSSQVGRIIGKSGQTVRELQRLTHAIIKLPDESQNNSAEETPVHIKGDFLSTQAAQRQIRALVSRNQQANSGPVSRQRSGSHGRTIRGQTLPDSPTGDQDSAASGQAEVEQEA
ncbi:Insulin-like growth factor 2 mRNA-binding protein 1 [Halotydeus destructor]|nr:Insulin-like growth factor 2 mRNA-binding protein 1 [Halotydeus destructor]